MIYSVFRPELRRYDYYETPAEASDVTVTASHRTKVVGLLSGRHGLGIASTQAVWTLPTSAKLVGSGPEARGRIAKKRGLLTLFGLGEATTEAGLSSPPWALTIGGAIAAWWFFTRPSLKRRRRR